MIDECILHEGAYILINSTDAVMNITNLKAIGNVQIPAHYILKN